MSGSTSPTRGTLGKIALPGLSKTCAPSPQVKDSSEDHGPSPVFMEGPPQQGPQERDKVERKSSPDKPQPRRPAVPHKPSRIPSTGNRATVMDVAQVWSEHEKQSSQNAPGPRSSSPNSPLESHSIHPMGTQTRPDHRRELEKEQEELPQAAVKAVVPGRGTQTSNPMPSTVETPEESERDKGASLKLPDLLTPTEKRKSSWEKYSELIMPALEEEWTPVPSPMPTLNKPPEAPVETKEEPVVATVPKTKRSGESKVDHLPLDLLSTTLEPERKIMKVSPTDLVVFGNVIRLLILSMLISG